MFIDALEVDDVLAHLLVTEGFSSVEEVAFIPVEDLLAIEGFDQEISEELRTRAETYLSEKEKKNSARRLELGMSDDLLEVEGLTSSMLVTLGEAGIKNREDLADLAGDELSAPTDGLLRQFELSEGEANNIIMSARAHWFDGETTPEEAESEELIQQEGQEEDTTDNH